MLKKIWYFFLYVTNNQEKSKHEEHYDVIFFILDTIFLIFGVGILLIKQETMWIPFLAIEYLWAVDNMRHNRP